MSRGWPMRPSGLVVFAGLDCFGRPGQRDVGVEGAGHRGVGAHGGQVRAGESERERVEAGLRHRVREVTRARVATSRRCSR